MKVLLIEDDKKLCQIIKAHLDQEGFVVDVCYSGEDGMFQALSQGEHYSIALVDRMLPVIDGITIIQSMRKKGISIPIIVITGMGQLQDKIDGLDNGADDYLVKPFHLSELSARIRALSRRPQEYNGSGVITFSDLALNLQKHELSCGADALTLTPTEFRIMEAFLEHPDRLISRAAILSKGWNMDDCIEPGNIDNYVYFLRKRLRSLGSKCYISSVYGSGYLLEEKHD